MYTMFAVELVQPDQTSTIVLTMTGRTKVLTKGKSSVDTQPNLGTRDADAKFGKTWDNH